MGYLVTRQSKAGSPRHTAVYVDVKGKRRSAGTYASETAADRAWQLAEARLAEGKIGDPKRGRQRLRQYVNDDWFPNHPLEAKPREDYRYLLDRYILPKLGDWRMRELMPSTVREWIKELDEHDPKVGRPTIRQCKTILDACLTTALHDQITFLHAGKGVKTPPVPTKTLRIITPEQFDTFYLSLPEPMSRLLVETAVESGLRWGELTELRPRDLDFASGMLTVSRAVVHLHAGGSHFIVKDYPKDEEWRELRLAGHLLDKLKVYIAENSIGPDDLLFSQPQPTDPARRERPADLPDPKALGLTEPNAKGRQYYHGTTTAYTAAPCRCRHCKDAVAAYRAARRAAGKDAPRKLPAVNTDIDGHLANDWFRRNVWNKAALAAGLTFRFTPHGLRHAHASWLVAGGADLQVVKKRLGHSSIKTTEQYLGTLPNADDVALDALDAIRGRGAEAEPKEPSELAQMMEMMTKLTAMVESQNTGLTA